MKRCLGILIMSLIVIGCAPYRQLKPKPELINAEQGYIELKHGDKQFELKKKGRYFISFPAAPQDHFYLILDLSSKQNISSFFTSSYEKNRPGSRILDETADSATLSAYAIDTHSPAFYWFIDKVNVDQILKMQYRYVPQWRFKFEMKHARLKATLEKNKINPAAYNSIGGGNHLSGMDFVLVTDTVSRHKIELDRIDKEVLEIQSIFPSSILNSNDQAYQNYVQLKTDLENEIILQKNYLAVLKFFSDEQRCRDNPGELLTRIDPFTSFFTENKGLPSQVLDECKAMISNRLLELKPFYDRRLGDKNDAKPLEQTYYRLDAFQKVPSLYQAAGAPMPAEIAELYNFMNAYDAKCKTVASLRDSVNSVVKVIKDQQGMPSDGFFPPLAEKMVMFQRSVPRTIDVQYGTYGQYPCSDKLNQDITAASSDITTRAGQLQKASLLVPQLNVMKNGRQFGSMINLLRENAGLSFLVEKYKEIDRLSVDDQVRSIRSSLAASAWPQAEEGLRTLHAYQNYLDPASTIPIKELAVRDLEDSLYNRVEQTTRARVMNFLDEKVNQLENIDSLYADSAFMPVWDITFSSGSQQNLVIRKNELVADLARLKETEFPAKAIKLLYEQFTRAPSDNGVLKARAIVSHGEHYKGADREIKLRVSECNPYIAKLISKAKDYRRVFALPVTSSKRGKNKYVVRFNINVPSDAAFPVYDVNIKLPKDIAKNAGSSQWYDEITLNKKPLKNEGRFSITAPTADNDYECQITPVQVNKNEKNILEITFSDDSFKAYMVSVMVQKPIIKKN